MQASACICAKISSVTGTSLGKFGLGRTTPTLSTNNNFATVLNVAVKTLKKARGKSTQTINDV